MCEILSKSGPSTGPCGTPEVTGNKQEVLTHTSITEVLCYPSENMWMDIDVFFYFATGVCGELNQKPCCNQRTRIL